MSRALFGALLALLFFLVLLASAPAYLLGYFLPQESVRMSGYSGTLWEGEASNLAVLTDAGWVQFGRTRWDLSVPHLLLFSPQVDIESRWGQQSLATTLRLFPSGDMRFRDLDASFSAGLVKRWMPVNLRGELNLLLETLEIEDGLPVAGAGRLVWRQAFWSGNQGSQALGDYVLEFALSGPSQGEARVTTLSGPLEVEGALAVTGRKYEVNARLTSDERIDQELSSALELMAAPIDGGYQLKFNSEF